MLGAAEEVAPVIAVEDAEAEAEAEVEVVVVVVAVTPHLLRQ